ncbi:HD-GYP domain-containing protein [Vibrio hepatarius]|uniref:HD-GYP domain-containing protein n=1 Tax=Vibrio hepatarius TaxID=171383 RepID=UPI001C09B010|nr:HD domain-containing phosphohydrolase [Vibrio hepatarius]MBU2898234.1 HD domain-containing protein [Vibrio hepatarius]
MVHSNYNARLTFKLYAIAAVVFAIYGGRVCPFLETLTPIETFVHIGVTFSLLFLIRHVFLKNHPLINKQHHTKLDSTLFFLVSIPLALFYNVYYNFGLESNVKVLFGMSLFGFLSGLILQLSSKIQRFDYDEACNFFELSGERQSIVNHMTMMVCMLLVILTVLLSMVAVKDIFWLENNPERLLDGSGAISVLKEFLYISLAIGGYVVTILILWAKLVRKVLLSQESSLLEVTQGNIAKRLPIFEHDELGSMASLTNKMLDSLQSSQNEVRTTRDVAIVSLSALAESRDNETGAHIMRTQEYVRALATYLSQFDKYKMLLTPSYIELLYKSAPLHDVGKVGIPDSILLKPGKLTVEEFEVMKRHPEIGANALSKAEKHLGSNSFLRLAKEISLTHHEKWDGSGYPKALVGEDIPLSGRLMAIADVYDALICERVYKKAFSHQKAKAIILEGNGSHFDPEVINAFMAIEHEFIDIADKYRRLEQEENAQVEEEMRAQA